MYFKTVYYSHFWYARFANLSLQALDRRDIEIERHLVYLRLLAVFFDTIYIPRTHLLTQVVPLQWEIPSAVFASDDAAFLREVGTLRVSVRPELDGLADNDRITSRAEHTHMVTYASSQKYLWTVAHAVPLIVESAEESIRNTVTFPEYARWLQIASPDLSRKVQAIVQRAQIKDVPFFHERFVHELRAELAQPEFEKVWRDTNSIYLTTGVPNQVGVIPYFNENIESMSYRYAPFLVDRYLFNPASLYTFLGSLLEPDDLQTLLHAPIERVLACLSKGGHVSGLLQSFRQAYCTLVVDVSASTRSFFTQGDLSQKTIAGWFEIALSGNLSRRMAVLEGAVEDAAAIGQTIDPIGAVIKTLTRPVVRYGKGAIERYLRRQRHPALYAFADTLHATLKRSR